MASVTFTDSYYVSGLGDTSFGVRVEYSEQSYSASANKTTVHVSSVQIMCSRMISGPVYGTLKIGNSTIAAFSGGYTNTASPSAGSYATVSGFSGANIDIGHDDAGAASMTFSLTGGSGGVFGISYNGKMFGVRTTASKSVSLTTQPRASTISSCPASAATQSTVTLAVSRKSSSFFHKASFKFGSTILYASSAFSTKLSYTIPRSWFASYPNKSSLTVTVSVQTYTNSACTTTVGSAAATTMTVTADTGMKPSVSSGWAALAAYNSGAASSFTGYIKGHSRAEVSFDASKVDLSNTAGAGIASYSVVCQGETCGASPYRTPVLASTAVGVVCSVTDTRGRTASESFVLSAMDYAAPTLSGIEIFRCGAGGTADEGGAYISVKASAACSPLAGQNSCTLSAAIAPSGGAFGAETALVSGAAALLGSFSPDMSYSVRLTAADLLGSTTVYHAFVPTRKWAMKFRPNGRGVAFGKAAETDGVFEIADDWTVKSKGIVDLIYPVGSIYLSVSSSDPSALFGGCWERIEDRFLLAAGQSFAAGESGGETAHTLTEDEMPRHTHKIYGGDNNNLPDWFGGSSASYGIVARTGTGYDRLELKGGGQAHNNMPPYLAVYIWKRTA